MRDNLKVGVVGAGVFGGYHSGKAAAHPSVDFVGIFDPNLNRAQHLADRHNLRVFNTYERLLDNVDAVILASPASAHGQQAIDALNAGRHLYIEKPIATDYDLAQTITRLAEEKDLVVQVGHQERFVIRSIGLGNVMEKPSRIEAVRFGPQSTRGTDTSVTLDLMTHDLDLILWLMGEMPNRVSSQTQNIYTDKPDAALAHLYYPNSSVRLEASRSEEAGRRQMRLIYPSGEVEIDFNAKTLRNTTHYKLNSEFAEHPDAKDSLGASVNDFVSAVLENRESEITAGHGLRAMKLALLIDGEMKAS